ncbi:MULTISPECIES: heme ABC transporter ATP-binding protein [unclassified Paenibacillus]|uniref:heme ABC transporter ATP-binding protein n=1 Tax=unclassified Paenibacillus TaxID=185978 RepID=UPI002F41855B
MTIVSVEKLQVQIDKRLILQDISFQARRGQFIGLIGPNGSGKSTLLRSLAAFTAHDEGQIKIADRHITAYRSRELAQIIGYVPQNTNIDFDFSVQHIVLMGRHPFKSRFARENGQDYDIAEQAMQLTDTLHLAERLVTNLSGGQRQMVFIAKALTQQPRLLLLDEPISALDIRHQLRVLELIRHLTGQGMTAIAALHDLNLAARYCDELLLLTDGCILHQGPPSDVLTPTTIRRAYQIEAHVEFDSQTAAPAITALKEAGNPF